MNGRSLAEEMMNRMLLVLALVLATTPAWAGNDISKVNGRIVAEAGRGYGDLDTVNGDIQIAAGIHTGSADTVNGDIEIGAAAQVGELSTVNGSVKTAAEVRVGGDIDTVNGSVFIDRGSEVNGDVETVNGSIGLVSTRVRGDIETVAGDITVGIGSHVEGGIHISRPGFSLPFKQPRKPRVVIGPNAVVAGSLSFEREVVLYVHSSATIGKVTGASVQRFDSEVAPERD